MYIHPPAAAAQTSVHEYAHASKWLVIFMTKSKRATAVIIAPGIARNENWLCSSAVELYAGHNSSNPGTRINPGHRIAI
jgi:hypothetical protein